MDPHFHNLTPNNSLLRHIFDRLVDQDENQLLKPDLALSWRTVDDTTWEFKLRPGVKFSDGSEFTANDVIYSFCRAPRVENSPSSFAVYSRAITGMRAPDPLTLIVTTGGPYPLVPNEVSTIAILSAKANGAGAGDVRSAGMQGRRHLPEDRDVQLRTGGDRHRALQACALHQGRPHHPRAQRRLLGRQAGLAARHVPPDHQRRAARRGAAVGRRRPDRERAHPGPRAGQDEREFQGRAGSFRPASSTCISTISTTCRPASPTRRQESVPRHARARGDLQGDRSRRHRCPHHGRRGGRGGRAAALHDVRRQPRHEGAEGRSRRRQEAARRSRLSQRLHA